MPESVMCPNCTAPLDVQGDGTTTLRCPYCNSSVIIPAEMRVRRETTTSSNVPSFTEIEEKLTSIREKALTGGSIKAIKLFRESFTIGLKDAKDCVEAMQRGEAVDAGSLQLKAYLPVNSTSLTPSTVKELVNLINAGDKINAIKLFRERTGVGLKDSMDVIDGMEASLSGQGQEQISEIQPGIPFPTTRIALNPATKVSKYRSSCIGIGFLLFLMVTVVLPILIGLTSQGGPLAGLWARVNPFAPGNVTMELGKEGSGPGYFSDARFVSVDNNGHIYVGEFNGGKIQVFDELGKYIAQWKATGELTGDIYLSGMAADRNGVVYAAVGGELFKYDGLTSDLIGQLVHPEGWGFNDVTVAPDGSIIAAWYKNRDDLIRFDQYGKVDLLVEGAISKVTSDSVLDMRVAVDGEGNIYTLAYFNEAVFVYSPDGRFISRFGSMGDAKGQFTSPRSIAVDNLGKIYIADFPGVMIYASDGRYLDTLPVNGAVMGMAFDDDNNLFVVAGEKVLRYKLK